MKKKQFHQQILQSLRAQFDNSKMPATKMPEFNADGKANTIPKDSEDYKAIVELIMSGKSGSLTPASYRAQHPHIEANYTTYAVRKVWNNCKHAVKKQGSAAGEFWCLFWCRGRCFVSSSLTLFFLFYYSHGWCF